MIDLPSISQQIAVAVKVVCLGTELVFLKVAERVTVSVQRGIAWIGWAQPEGGFVVVGHTVGVTVNMCAQVHLVTIFQCIGHAIIVGVSRKRVAAAGKLLFVGETVAVAVGRWCIGAGWVEAVINLPAIAQAIIVRVGVVDASGVAVRVPMRAVGVELVAIQESVAVGIV